MIDDAASRRTRALGRLSAERSVEGGFTAERVEFIVPSELAYFDGHFPGNPVLPAVAQLELAVLPEIARAHPDLGKLVRATKLKFRAPLRPGDRLRVSLTRRHGDAIVAFVIERGGRVTGEGTLHFAARERGLDP